MRLFFLSFRTIFLLLALSITMLLTIVLGLVVCCGSPALAAVRMPAIYGDNMVTNEMAKKGRHQKGRES
jgi:hypothetical protein